MLSFHVILIDNCFYPIFTLAAAYIADNLCTKNRNSSFFKLKIRGLQTRAAYKRERLQIESGFKSRAAFSTFIKKVKGKNQ